MKQSNPQKLTPGTPAPNFSLLDQKGERHNLAEYRSVWILVYFFPKEAMDKCAENNCSIREDFDLFKTRRLSVMGISNVTVAENLEFSRRFNLPFRLLADTERRVIKQYGAAARAEGNKRERPRRLAVLITPQGEIAKTYRPAGFEAIGEEVMADVRRIPATENRRVAPGDMVVPSSNERRFRI